MRARIKELEETLSSTTQKYQEAEQEVSLWFIALYYIGQRLFVLNYNGFWQDCSKKIGQINNNFLRFLRWFDTVFSWPYLTFSFGRLAKFSDWLRCEIYTSYWSSIEGWNDMSFAEINISIATINGKPQNQWNVNFMQMRFDVKNSRNRD